MAREAGFYWVKYDGEWVVALYARALTPDDELVEFWSVVGDDRDYDADSFEEIGPKIEPPA